jgi:hypothetical protein
MFTLFASGSMEPAFQRGDILFLWLGSSSFRVGEIVVFKIEGRDIPIVHRVIKVHEKCGPHEPHSAGPRALASAICIAHPQACCARTPPAPQHKTIAPPRFLGDDAPSP